MSYDHLHQRERMCLFYLLQSGFSLREIGRRLNRSHTTLSREVKRNKRFLVAIAIDRPSLLLRKEKQSHGINVVTPTNSYDVMF